MPSLALTNYAFTPVCCNAIRSNLYSQVFCKKHLNRSTHISYMTYYMTLSVRSFLGKKTKKQHPIILETSLFPQFSWGKKRRVGWFHHIHDPPEKTTYGFFFGVEKIFPDRPRKAWQIHPKKRFVPAKRKRCWKKDVLPRKDVPGREVREWMVSI